MKRFGVSSILWPWFACALISGCASAPRETPAEPSRPVPANDSSVPSPSPKDIRWEEECLVYPRQEGMRGLQGSGIRRNCTPMEAPESSVLTDGLASDEKTALGLARVVLTRVYGERTVDSAQPTITARGDRWLVQWEVKTPEPKPDALKRLSVEVVKKTGAISRVFVSVVKE